MEEIVGQAKWTTTNHTKGWSSAKEGDVVYMGGIGFLLPENQTINSNKYCSHLDQLKAALDKKCLELVTRKRIIFHQDNARLHVSLMTRQKLLQLGWEVLNGKNFNSLEDCKRHLEQFFAQKDKKFWEDGVMKLPEKWQQVGEQNGEYVVQ